MIKNILWDFDGVILGSLPVREYGFRKIFEKFENQLIDKLIEYHNYNGGLSRFHKIKYFYNELLGKEISEEKIQEYASQFTKIMKRKLIEPNYLIQDSIEFIQQNYKSYNFHIVSGSEHDELNYLCLKLGINDYFLSINGSPTPKNILVKNLLEDALYKKKETILIGDSINDYEAAFTNNINFYGYKNLKLKQKSVFYITNFKDFSEYIEQLD